MRFLVFLAVVCAYVSAELEDGQYKIQTTYGCHKGEEAHKDVCNLYAMQASMLSKVGLDKKATVWTVKKHEKKDGRYQIFRKDSSGRKRGWTFTHSFSQIMSSLTWKTYFKISARGDGYRLELVDNCHLKGSYRWPCGQDVDFTSAHYIGVGNGSRKVNFKFIKV